MTARPMTPPIMPSMMIAPASSTAFSVTRDGTGCVVDMTSSVNMPTIPAFTVIGIDGIEKMGAVMKSAPILARLKANASIHGPKTAYTP